MSLLTPRESLIGELPPVHPSLSGAPLTTVAPPAAPADDAGTGLVLDLRDGADQPSHGAPVHEAPAALSVLLVHPDPAALSRTEGWLRAAGLDVSTAASSDLAAVRLRSDIPDVVVADAGDGADEGLALVRRMREDPATRHTPLLLLSSRDDPAEAVRALALGADDHLRQPVHPDELVARIRARSHRPATEPGALRGDRYVGLLSEERFLEEVERELQRSSMTGRDGWVAVVDVAERAAVERRLGPRGAAELVTALAQQLRLGTTPLERLGRSDDGRLLVLVPETSEVDLVAALRQYAVAAASNHYDVLDEPLTATPVIGYAGTGDQPALAVVESPAQELLARASDAQRAAARDLNLQPQRWVSELSAGGHTAAPGPVGSALRITGQLLTTLVLGLVLPYLVYTGLYLAGVDVSPWVYTAVVASLVLTSALIWLEGLLALDPPEPPEAPDAAPPRASAVIAAYLPNEAATILETVESFLAVDYPDLEVVLAYNSPQVLPVEAALHRLAEQDPRFTALRVEGSTSKAQNVNAALQHITGEFVGLFDADHHPDPDSFHRAWRWIAGGYDVVQGHCVIRNGDVSAVSRTVAVEFEAIYAVSHPGRARLHGFGVFGGSNGYWKTSVLRSTRMFGAMLTEDIDSSIRLLLAGGKIASDPKLISRELAPTTVSQLWNQRMRWAQGWFQVSMRYLVRGALSRRLSLRQKVGLCVLLGWREAYVWISLQVLPLLAFIAWRDGGVSTLQWAVALFVLTALFTLSAGPAQVLFAHRLAVPEVKRRTRWFWSYLLVSTLVYTEWKNVVSRIAQVKEFAGERVWRVTPRQSGPGAGGAA